MTMQRNGLVLAMFLLLVLSGCGPKPEEILMRGKKKKSTVSPLLEKGKQILSIKEEWGPTPFLTKEERLLEAGYIVEEEKKGLPVDTSLTLKAIIKNTEGKKLALIGANLLEEGDTFGEEGEKRRILNIGEEEVVLEKDKERYLLKLPDIISAPKVSSLSSGMPQAKTTGLQDGVGEALPPEKPPEGLESSYQPESIGLGPPEELNQELGPPEDFDSDFQQGFEAGQEPMVTPQFNQLQ